METRTLTLRGADPTSLLPTDVPSIQLSDQARSYATASKAVNTRRAYAAQLKRWAAYRELHGRPPFPADAAAVANWLSERAAAGQAYATLRTAIAAIRAGSSALGLEFNTGAPAIENVMRGIGRTEARAQRQAEPIRGGDVSEILASLGASILDARDGALLALGYVFALRRSEAVGLDLDRHGDGDGFVCITATTVELVLVRSKTSKAGEVETVTVPRPAVATAVATLERWIALSGIQPGDRILRGVTKAGLVKGPLHPQSIPKIIRRRVTEHYERQGVPRDKAATEAQRYSGHSLRVGFAVTAAEAGSSADEIALVTRHRSLEMPRRYAQKADALKRSPFNRKGVGL